MKKCFFILLFAVQVAFAQEIPVKLLEKTPLKAEKYIGTDDYGNIYFIQENIFYKIGEKKTYQFNDLQLGKLTSVDIINPLKITLFYENMNTVVFVDRHLIEIGRTNFTTLPKFRNLGFATTASNNSLWTFNVDLQQLEVFDYLKKEVLASSQPIGHKVISQKSNFNFCWLLTEKTLEKYNSYGSLISKILNPGFTKLTENNGHLIAAKKEELFFLKKASSDFVPLKLPQIEVKNFYLNDENLYIYNGKYIHTYQINPRN